MEHEFLLILTVCMGMLACFWDLKTGKIPNKLTFSAIAAGIVLNTCFHGFGGLIFSLKGFAAGICLLLIPYLMGGMGAGDVKFLGAIGALQGSYFVFITMLAAGLAGGAISLLLYRFRYFLAVPSFGLLRFSIVRADPQTGKLAFPYGIPILIGLLFAACHVV